MGEASAAAAFLIDCSPDERRVALTDFSAHDMGYVSAAVADEMGTPYGLWRDDPIGFVEDGLGETLWSKQRDVLRDLQESDRVVVPSCHGAGKTWLAARVVGWHLCVWPPGSVQAPTTADVGRKVKGLLWGEINAMHARHSLPGECQTIEWKLGGRIAAWGFSPDDYDEDAFGGIHRQPLVVVDEAGNLSPILGRSLESVMATAGSKLLAIGNPPIDETGSPWFEGRTESRHYRTVRISSFDTPNLTGESTPPCHDHPDLPEHPISDHLPTEASIDIVREDYGENDPYYIARIKAEFPKDYGQKAIPRSWVEEAVANTEPPESTWIRLGVDPAAEGADEFAIARAEGFRVRIVKATRVPTRTYDMAGAVLEEIEVAEDLRSKLGERRRVRVKVDDLGLGMGVTDTLKAWRKEGRHDAEIVAVRVSKKCAKRADRAKYINQRAQMWWEGRKLCQPDGEDGSVDLALDVGEDEIRQLSLPSYDHDSGGRRKIESKGDMLKRGVGSPDRAEAILMAIYEPTPPRERTSQNVPPGDLPTI